MKRTIRALCNFDGNGTKNTMTLQSKRFKAGDKIRYKDNLPKSIYSVRIRKISIDLI